MPIKNLVSDFGGVGDAQTANGVLVTTSGTGSRNIAFGSGVSFSGGDVGKAISFWASSIFGNAKGTIASVSDSTHITLAADLIDSNLAAVSLSSASTNLVWGTDNTDALTGASGSWRAWAQTQTNPADPPILEVPDGFYAWRSSQAAGAGPCVGVGNNPTIRGISGNPDACGLYQLQVGEMKLGGDLGIIANRGLTAANGGIRSNSVRLLTANAGASSIFLKDPSGLDDGGATFGARVAVGRAALITAFDTQGIYNSFIGYPPNAFFYEWRTITAYNSGTGEVTLDAPLTQTYRDDYPEWGVRTTQFGSDQGGPATMWIAPDGYNTTLTLENMTLYCFHNQMGANIRNVVLNNIKCVGPGLYPTVNDNFTANNCVYTQILEVDKMTNLVTWNNCTIRGLQQQSASPNRMVINGGTVAKMETCRDLEMNNVAFIDEASIIIGVSGYGRTDRVVLNGCTGIASFTRGGVATDDLNGSSGVGEQQNASDFYSFTGGVIRFLKSQNNTASGQGQANLTRWAVPGTWVTFDDKYIDQVDACYEDGTYCYIRFKNTTGWPFTPVVRILVHPCPDFTMRNCTGTAPQLEDWNQAPARIPLYSYSKRTLVAGATSATALPSATRPFLFGRLVTEKINVTTPYSGALTIKDNQFANRAYVKRSDYTTASDYGNTVNMNISGERVIRAATTAQNAKSGDALEDLTSLGEIGFYNSGNSAVVFSANVTNGETPTATIEYVMDQGIPPAGVLVVPFRLRLRA